MKIQNVLIIILLLITMIVGIYLFIYRKDKITGERDHIQKSATEQSQIILPSDEIEKALYSNSNNDLLYDDVKNQVKPKNLPFLESLLGDEGYKHHWGEAMYGLAKINTDQSIAKLLNVYKNIGDPYFWETDDAKAQKIFITLELGYNAQNNDKAFNFLCEYAFNYELSVTMIEKWGYTPKGNADIIYITVSHLIQAVGISGRDDAYDIIYYQAKKIYENDENKYKNYKGSFISAISYWDMYQRFGKKDFNAKPLVDLELFQEWKKQRPELDLWYRGEISFPNYNKNIPWHILKKVS